jgi:pimeloyl-ACP methyl ester carboxylesterase
MTSDNLGFLGMFQEFMAVGEFAKFAGSVWSWRMIPRSNRPRPILLIPGFMAGDASLYPFANWLRSRGHQVFFAGIMSNTDCPRRTLDRLSETLQNLHARYEERLVVIGHSLGGIYARELARRCPEAVEQTILLGSPVRDGGRNNPFMRMLGALTIGMRQRARGCKCDIFNFCGIRADEPSPDVPQAIIFSKADAVVDWITCIESGPNVRVFEVDSTHVGLPYSLETLRIVHELIENGADQDRSTGRIPNRTIHPMPRITAGSATGR